MKKLMKKLACLMGKHVETMSKKGMFWKCTRCGRRRRTDIKWTKPSVH